MADHGGIDEMEEIAAAEPEPAEAGAAEAETATAEREPETVEAAGEWEPPTTETAEDPPAGAETHEEPVESESGELLAGDDPAESPSLAAGLAEAALDDEDAAWDGAAAFRESEGVEAAGAEAGADESAASEAGVAPAAGEAEEAVAVEPGEDAPAGTDTAGAEPGSTEPESEPATAPARERRGRTFTDRGEMEAVLESVLFVASEPISRGRLLELFDEDESEEAAQALETVLARYTGEEGRGIMAEEVAGGIRLVTRPELVGWLRRFFEVSGSSKLSMAALETLAIVAYRQPITSPEIQELRSVSSSGVLSTLLQRRLVRIAGRKEVVGKPFLYATTREFLVHFGLKSLKDLPPLEELEETFAEGGAGAAFVLRGDEGEGGAPGAGEDREERILREVAALEEGAAEAPEAEGEGPEAAPASRRRPGRGGSRSNGGAPAVEPFSAAAGEPGEPSEHGRAGDPDGSGDADREGR